MTDSLSELTDRRLCALVQSERSQEALDELLRRYFTTLSAGAQAYLEDADFVEQALRESWLGVLQGGIDWRNTGDRRDGLRPHVFRILARRCIDLRLQYFSDRTGVKALSSDNPADRCVALNRAMQVLPLAEQEIAFLHCYCGFDNNDLATALAMTPGDLAKRADEASEALRRGLLLQGIASKRKDLETWGREAVAMQSVETMPEGWAAALLDQLGRGSAILDLSDGAAPVPTAAGATGGALKFALPVLVIVAMLSSVYSGYLAGGSPETAQEGAIASPGAMPTARAEVDDDPRVQALNAELEAELIRLTGLKAAIREASDALDAEAAEVPILMARRLEDAEDAEAVVQEYLDQYARACDPALSVWSAERRFMRDRFQVLAKAAEPGAPTTVATLRVLSAVEEPLMFHAGLMILTRQFTYPAPDAEAELAGARMDPEIAAGLVEVSQQSLTPAFSRLAMHAAQLPSSRVDEQAELALFKALFWAAQRERDLDTKRLGYAGLLGDLRWERFLIEPTNAAALSSLLQTERRGPKAEIAAWFLRQMALEREDSFKAVLDEISGTIDEIFLEEFLRSDFRPGRMTVSELDALHAAIVGRLGTNMPLQPALRILILLYDLSEERTGPLLAPLAEAETNERMRLRFLRAAELYSRGELSVAGLSELLLGEGEDE